MELRSGLHWLLRPRRFPGPGGAGIPPARPPPQPRPTAARSVPLFPAEYGARARPRIASLSVSSLSSCYLLSAQRKSLVRFFFDLPVLIDRRFPAEKTINHGNKK